MSFLRILALGLAVLAVPSAALTAPYLREPRLHPGHISPLPSYVHHVEPAIVGIRVRVAASRPSAATLGTQRFASGVIFDPGGYVLTVSYVLLDAEHVEVQLRDGRTMSAELVGLDLEVGVGVIKLHGAGPWRAATLADSQSVTPGDSTGTIGVDEDNDLVAVIGEVQAVRPFAAYWEYMLRRAFLVAPPSPAFGGSALVNSRGEIIGVTSLRLGKDPQINLAIPTEFFLPVKDELLALGRVVSRPTRPWLGLYTAGDDLGVVVNGFSPAGPAGRAGFMKDDVILEVNGAPVRSQEEFYEQLWQARAGDTIRLLVRRRESLHSISVRSVDRYDVYRTTTK